MSRRTSANLLAFLLLLVMAVSGYAASSSSAPRVVKFNQGVIENRLRPDFATQSWKLWVKRADTSEYLEIVPVGPGSTTKYIAGQFGTVGWWLGTLSSPFDRVIADTVIVASRLQVNGEYISDFTGYGTRLNGGQFEVFLPNLVGTDWITDQTILGRDIDSTSNNVVFDGAYEGTSGVADSQYATKAFSKLFLGNKPISGATPSDNYIPKYDAVLDSFMWEADAGATSGDDIKVDSNGSTAGGVWDSPTGFVLQFGENMTATKLGSDTLKVSSSGGSGRFGVAADTSFNSQSSTIENLDAIGVDTVRGDQISLKSGGGNIDSVSQMTSAYSVSMNIRTVGTHPSQALTFQSGQANPSKFYYNTDEIMTIGSGGVVAANNAYSHLKAWKSLTATDSARIAGQLINGDTSLASEGEMTDYVSSNYVSKANENVQRGATADVKAFLGATPNDTALIIERFQNAGTDSTRLTVPGKMILVSSVPDAAKFDSVAVANYIRFNGTGIIRDALAGSFDTVQVDRQFRMNGSTSGFLRLAAPATVTSYDLIMPSALGSGGYFYVNSSGVMSFAAGSAGGGSDTLLSATAAPGGRADTIEYISRGGDTIIAVGDSGLYTQLWSGQNTGGFSFGDAIRTQGGETISDDSSLASEREIRAYAEATYAPIDSNVWHYFGATNPKDTVRWNATTGLAAAFWWTLAGNDTLTIKPGTSTATVVIGNEGLTESDSLNVKSKLYILNKAWPTSYSNGQQLTIDGSGNYSWADPAGVSSGTGDTVIFNTEQTTTGTEYSSVSNKIKMREGSAIDITREDSTTFDMIRPNVRYDNSTIGLNGSNQLYVPTGGITATQLGTGSVTNTKLGTNAISLDKMDDASVGTSEIVNASILFADWAQNSASTYHLPRWSGSAWVAAFVDSNSIQNLGIAPRNISSAGATPGDLMGWNGTSWVPTGGAGTGTITSMGSITSGAAFSSVASSHQKWFGMQNAVGWPHFYFDSTSITSYGRDLQLRGANLRIGQDRTDNAKTGIVMASDTSVNNGDFGIWAHNRDSGNGDKTQIQLIGTANAAVTTGGDIGLLFNTNNSTATWGLGYGLGIDWSDGKRLKLMANADGTIGTVGDYFAMDSTGRAVFWGGLYLGNEAMTTADSLASTRGYARTGGYQTEYIGITGGQVYFTPEPNASVAKFMTWPWVDTTGTYTRVDSMIARTYLWRVTDTTAGNDTLFAVTQWQADVACSLLAVNYAGKTSSATAGTSSLDSVVLYVNGVRIQGIKPAFASTALDTIAINFTDVQLTAQDLVTLEWRYVLGNDAFADCKWANIERRKR